MEVLVFANFPLSKYLSIVINDGLDLNFPYKINSGFWYISNGFIVRNKVTSHLYSSCCNYLKWFWLLMSGSVDALAKNDFPLFILNFKIIWIWFCKYSTIIKLLLYYYYYYCVWDPFAWDIYSYSSFSQKGGLIGMNVWHLCLRLCWNVSCMSK